jgi:hypothetical protein
MVVSGKTCQELIDKAETRLAAFFKTSVEELENKVNYEFNMYESSHDGVELSIFSADVHAKLK